METTLAGKTVSKTWNEFEDFNVGDVVRLKSGGPNMTVDAHQGSRLLCVWFVETNVHRQEFDQGALEKVAAEKKESSSVS